jgi:hypothetical protein
MIIQLIKNGIVENTIVCESVEKAQELFPGYECVEVLPEEILEEPLEENI